MIRVGVVDRSPVFILGLAGVLTDHGMRVIGAANSPTESENWLIDVSVVEPEALDQERSSAEIQQLSRLSKVLLVAARVDDVLIPSLLRGGAVGVVPRSSQPGELAEAVRAIAGGAQWPDSAMVGALRAKQDSGSENQMGVLSDREEQVLRQLSAGLTHSQIARRLGISRHTVDTYVKRIRSKLGVGNKAELTRAAVTIGLCA